MVDYLGKNFGGSIGTVELISLTAISEVQITGVKLRKLLATIVPLVTRSGRLQPSTTTLSRGQPGGGDPDALDGSSVSHSGGSGLDHPQGIPPGVR